MIFDTHVHFNSEKYKELNIEIKDLINNAIKDNVTYFAIPSFDFKSCVEAIKISSEFKNTYAIIGIHPTNTFETNDEEILKIESLLNDPKVVAIGECGLDYYWDTDREIQEKYFVKQIQLALKHNLPLVIHTRDAIEKTYEILKENNASLVGGVIHSFSGSKEMAQKFIKLNFKIGLSGPITFKNNKFADDLINSLNIKDIVVETDAPYLTPHPHRGKLNEPKYVSLVVSKIAEVKQLSYDEVAKITTNNAFELFRLEKKMFKTKKKLNILIIGCSHIGSSFANECSELGHNVIVIDKDHHAFVRLNENYMGARVTEDGADINVLESVNIKKMDVVISATDFENVNIMVSQIARVFYDTKQIIAILETKSKESICEGMNIEFIYPTRLSICELEKKLNIEGVSLWK